jgi:lipopolysaccharide/colanic/teichoic acid biosynthesis glycosyltransferase
MIEGADERKESLLHLNEANGPLFKIRDDPRMTLVGKLLRKFSLDELPQFYNVLRGEMSVIGPRPPLPNEVEQYQEWHKRRLEVAPGITGLSQISGRSDLTFDETALLDIYYIENWSLGLDSKIILQTIPRVIFGNGAY